MTAELSGAEVTSVCSSDSYEVKGESSTLGSVMIEWSGAVSSTTSNGSSVSGVSVVPSQTYIARAELDGCYSLESTETVSISESGTVTVSSLASVLCESDKNSNNPKFTATTQDVDVSSGYTWVWVDESGIETEITTNSNEFSGIPSMGRDYVDMYVKVNNNAACGGTPLSSNTSRVDVVQTPVAQIDWLLEDGVAEKQICREDAPKSMSVIDRDGLNYSSSNVSVIWTNASGDEVSSSSNYVVNESGRYEVVVVNTENGVSCSSDSDLKTVNSDDVIEVSIQDLVLEARASSRDVEEGETVVLTGETFGLYPTSDPVYEWSVENAVIGSTGQVEHQILITGEYIVTLTDRLTGCSASASIQINKLEPVVIPSAFTPNGDGENDTWVIPGLETYRKASLKVFNRWGQLVYETSGSYDHSWDGGDLPIGTYYYIIELNVPGREPLKGDVTLLR